MRIARPVVGWSVLLTVLVALGGYYSFIAYRSTHEVVREYGLPKHDLRIAVMNATAKTQLTRTAVDYIDRLSHPGVQLEVVSSGLFQLHRVKESFVIYRDQDREGAETLAGMLGIPLDRVMFQSLSHNVEHVTTTVVLGEDFERLIAAGGKMRSV